MKWLEVLRVHGSQAGVSVRLGRVISVLIAQDSGHCDAILKNELLYAVPSGASYRHAVHALHAAHRDQEPFRVFRKVRRNQWEDLGLHVVVSSSEQDGSILFRLRAHGMLVATNP